jgi:hypothetical protein
VGGKIDVLKVEDSETEVIEGWGIATIIEATEIEVLCTFDGMPDDKVWNYLRNESKIAPLGSRTGDWEWRNHLAVDMRVDVFDTQGKWYLSTVLEAKEKKKVKMVKIGFRIYMPDGTKVGDDKRPYEGWSSKYDTWIPINSIKIQR